MPIQGLRTTANFVANGRPENWREGILLLYPNGKMPLTGLTSLMKSRIVDDPSFHWWEKQMHNKRFQLHATSGNLDAAGSITTLTLAAGEKGLSLKQGDVLYVEETGEYLRVSADPSSETSVPVQRGFAGSAKAAVDPDAAGVNPYVLRVGSAYEQGSLAPTGVAYDPTEKSNYTQIFRDTLEATRTAMKTRLRTGDAVKEAKRECLEQHGMAMEWAFLLGKKSSSTLNGKPITTMDGLINWIDPANIRTATTDYSGGVTMEGLEEYLYNIFRYGSSEKLAFSGNRALLTIQQIVRKNSSMQITSGIKEYGMNVTRLTCPFGELVLKTHPLFNEVQGGVTATTAYYGMESWLFVIDQANLTYVSLKDSDTKYQPDLQDNGLDGMKSGYLSEVSIEVHHPKTHYLIKNLVAAAVDA